MAGGGGACDRIGELMLRVDGPIAPAPGTPGQPVLRWHSRARTIDAVAVELGKICGSISLTAPSKPLNGPSMMLTTSPAVKSIWCFGSSTPIRFLILAISASETGVGSVPLPTNPVTPGVLRTMYHVSSVSFISTST